MNKALHVFVYLFLVLAGVSLWFEIELNSKRSMLTARNRMQEDYFVRIAKTIEKDAAPKGEKANLSMDVSPIEDRIVDTPDTENLLEDYNNILEVENLETFNWENSRSQLRMVYLLDSEGNVLLDAGAPITKGKGTEDELLSQLFESAKDQQSRLNTTRAELKKLRGKLEETVRDINDLKPKMRQDKVTITEKNEEIAKLENEKIELNNQITKQKSQIDELNTEVSSLHEEVNTAKNETEEVREELTKSKEMVERLKKIMKEMFAAKGTESSRNIVTAGSLSAGDKGTIVEVDNENMFAIVRFGDKVMNELKGGNAHARLPLLELGVKRPGFKGPAGEFVGKIRIRQEVLEQPFVICDILGSWEQAKLQANDIIFAD